MGGCFARVNFVNKAPELVARACRVAIFTQADFFLLDHKVTYSPQPCWTGLSDFGYADWEKSLWRQKIPCRSQTIRIPRFRLMIF
jgi:hypothetical protein